MPRPKPSPSPAPWAAPPPFLAEWREVDGVLLGELAARLDRARAEAAPGFDMDTLLAIERLRLTELPFWREHIAIEAQSRMKGGRRTGLLLALLGPDGPIALDGQSRHIHAINQEFGVALDTPAAALAYLRLFCSAVHGEGGRFAILETAEGLAGTEIAPPRITEESRDALLAEATVRYQDQLFRCRFRLRRDGMVEMQDDEPLPAATLPPERRSGAWRLFPRGARA